MEKMSFLPTPGHSIAPRTYFLAIFSAFTVLFLIYHMPSATVSSEDWAPNLSGGALSFSKKPKMSRPGDTVELDGIGRQSGTIIFIHGLGGTPEMALPLVSRARPHLHQIRWILPSAVHIPVTANKGGKMSAWFDIKSMSVLGNANLPTDEDEEGMMLSIARFKSLVTNEIARGIPPERIVLAGFSQGCAMALLTAISYPEKLAGIACMSGWLPLSGSIHTNGTDGSKMHGMQTNFAHEMPIYWGHGTADFTVPFFWGAQTIEHLTSMGFKDIEVHRYEGEN
ncbi:alpha/beta-hydrolase [Meredithblackwellia eburnea MCA 4105]